MSAAFEDGTGQIGVTLPNEIDIIGGGSYGPPPPLVDAVAQYGNVVCVRVRLNPVQLTQMVAVSLYRARSQTGPWEGPIDATQLDFYDLTTDLVDTSPIFGIGVYYAAKATTVADSSTDLSGAPFYYAAAAPAGATA